MNNTNIEPTPLKDVLVIKRAVFSDDRGFFRETFRLDEIRQHTGLEINFVQGNHSRSRKNTLRGIHVAPWHKLVTVNRGLVQQVVADTRKNSETFGQNFSIIIGEDNFYSILVPAGCGNSFLVLSDWADYTYVTTQEWAPGLEKNIAWNDPELGIHWQSDSPDLSEKDLNNPSLKDFLNG